MKCRFQTVVAPLIGVTGFVPAIAAGGIVTGNYAADFNASRGYAEVSSFNGTNVSAAGLRGGSFLQAYVNLFFDVENSGGTVTHAFTVAISNVTSSPITSYRFLFGETGTNYWLSADTDSDGIPDRDDPDMDNDGRLNAADNAVWVANASQADSDGDQWGNVMDLAPNNASVPVNQVGSQALVPWLRQIGSMVGNSSALTNGSSDSFSTVELAFGRLTFSNGSIAPGATATFTFDASVADDLISSGFVLQMESFPEPGGAAIAAMLLSTAGRRLRRRRSVTRTLRICDTASREST